MDNNFKFKTRHVSIVQRSSSVVNLFKSSVELIPAMAYKLKRDTIQNSKKSTYNFKMRETLNKTCVITTLWGGSKGGSGGAVEPPKVNVKTYNKRVVKKSEPTQQINISFENDISLCLCTRNSKQQ